MLIFTSVVLLTVLAQSTGSQVNQDNIPQSVQVAKKKNPGDLPYDGFYKNQVRILAYMSNEPRTIDFASRASFNALGKQEQDDQNQNGVKS